MKERQVGIPDQIKIRDGEGEEREEEKLKGMY